MLYSDVRFNFSYSDRDFYRVQSIAQQEAGIHLPYSKRNLVFSRVSRRIRYTQRGSFKDYLDYVCSLEGGKEMQELVGALTTNVTHFFRENSHFEHLERYVVPQLRHRAEMGGRCRLWSAACSTGEEAWSIAMLLMKCIPDAPWLDIKILATDINQSVVKYAKKGEYHAEDIRCIPEALKKKYIQQVHKGEFSITGRIRKLPTFGVLNLNKIWPFYGSFDVIFCCNVAIYFDYETRNVLWKRLASRLLPGGFLYVGHSERVENMKECQLEAIAPTIYVKKG